MRNTVLPGARKSRKTRKKRVELDPQPPTQERKNQKRGTKETARWAADKHGPVKWREKNPERVGGMMRNKYLAKAPLVAHCQRPQNAHLDRRAIEGGRGERSLSPSASD